LFRSTLSARAAAVHAATNERQAIDILRSQAIDLMFVDLSLADANGLDLLRTAHQISRQLVSVVMTEQGTLQSAVEAMRLGACDYIVKPFDPQRILDALDHALAYKSVKLPGSPTPSDTGKLSAPPPLNVVAASPQMRESLENAALAAASDMPIIIEGESGVGKQMLARWIHQRDREPNGWFVHFPAAALQDARPGAEHPEWQRFVVGSASTERANAYGSGADRCTFYIEHVEQLPMWAQRQLLQRIEWTSLSSSEYAPPDAARLRVIASTTTSLDPAVADGTFSRGLYDVLRLTPLSIPPLRKRPEDIRGLAYHFLERFCSDHKRDPGPYRRMIAEETWQLMLRYSWPGNARELISLIVRALLSKDNDDFERMLIRHVSSPAPAPNCDMISVPLVGDLRTIERCVVREVVRRLGGNKAAAARALGMHRRTLYRVLLQN
jgi:two-component system response regulator HydG